MPREISIDRRFQHRLGNARQAVEKIKGLLSRLAEDHTGDVVILKQDWTDFIGEFSLSVKGATINGFLAVCSTELRISGTAKNLPAMAVLVSQRTIESKLAQMVEDQLRKLEREG